MTAEFLKRVSGDAQYDPDKAFVWISFNPDLVDQSYRKLRDYLHGGIAGLYDTSEISQRGKLAKNRCAVRQLAEDCAVRKIKKESQASSRRREVPSHSIRSSPLRKRTIERLCLLWMKAICLATLHSQKR